MVLLFVALGFAFGVLAQVISGGGIPGVFASFIAFVVAIAGGVIGGAKRSIAKALEAAVSTAQIGKRVAESIVSRSETRPDKGGWLSRGVLRISEKIARPIVDEEQKKGTPVEQIGGIVDATLADKAQDMVIAATALAFGIAFAGLLPAIAIRVMA